MATFWGPLAQNPNVIVGSVVAIKGAKVSDYGGKSLNVSESQCHVEFNPKGLKKTKELLQYYEQNGTKSKFESITQLGGRGGDQNVNTASLPYCSIS